MIKNIVAREEYESNGEQKVSWLQIGKLIEKEDGKQYVKLNIMPGQICYVFDQKEKAEGGQQQTAQVKTWSSEGQNTQVEPESSEIPF